MSGSLTPTVASAPTTVQVATNMVALTAAQTGVPTDFNKGSQVRTLMESLGSVVELQAVSDQALAMQALAYSAMSLFGISQSLALPATGTVIFATSFPLASAIATIQAVGIPSGTLVSTPGGVQFATTSAVTLASGTTSIAAGIIATAAGTAGNVAASAIAGLPLTPLGYPLFASNAVATAGGANAGSQSSALAQFTAKAASLGLASPVAVANAAIGTVATGTGETCLFAACYEPWIAAGSGAGSGTAGFTLFVDNGTGSASAALLAAVASLITGSQTTNQSGYRPAGVPFQVSGVAPVYAFVGATGTLIPGLFGAGSVSDTAVSGVTAYFDSLGISAPLPGASGLNIATQPQIAARIADAGLGAFSSLAVELYYSGSSSPVAMVSGGVGTRIILAGMAVSGF